MMNFKTFGRRKSSGNILDSEKQPQQSSFRVLERPSVDTSVKSFGSSTDSPKRRTPVHRPKSSPLQTQNTKRSAVQDERTGSAREPEHGSLSDSKTWTRGSDQTFGSSSTADIHRNLRDSYASTDPSSVESIHQMTQKSQPAKAPAEDRKFSFRTMSFTRRNTQPHDEDNETVPDLPSNGIRQRAMTESSYTSTVVPPKLDIGENGDFGSSFSSDLFAKRKSTILEESDPTRGSSDAGRDRDPNRTRLGAASGNAEEQGSFTSDLDFYYSDTAAAILAVNGGTSSGNFLNDQNSQSLAPLRTNPYSSDASSSRAREPSPYSRGAPRAPASHLFPAQEPSRLAVKSSTNDPAASDDDVPLIFDTSKSAVNSRINVRSVNHVKQPSKVMTPAEFAKYKSQKENGLLEKNEGQERDSESDDDYDRDDDEYELERNRKAVKQRAIQDAHLSVYRQQMMKTTGEQPSDLPTTLSRSNRPGMDRMSKSTPNLPVLTTKPPSDDEDDDIPLGVLQAHGFPSKQRPPSRLNPPAAGSSSRPTSQLSSYPAPAGATRNESSAGGGGRLPVFARNLPSDPYIGASHVTHPNRESMSLGGGSQQPAPMPPGGLVGVIAGEERARAMRRGSPNHRGTYDAVPTPTVPAFQQPQMPAGLLTPSEAHMQTVNSMAQMNQALLMQMDFMQQMMRVHGMQAPQPQMQMPMQMMGGQSQQFAQNMMQQNGGMGQHRPGSSSSQMPHQRAMSMMPSGGFNGPFNASRSNLGIPSSSQSVYGMPDFSQGYAPSIAPSERSNVGQPSRYRPVSTVGVEPMHSQTPYDTRAFPNRPESRATVAGLNATGEKKRATVRAVEKPKKPSRDSDDDDKDGWAAMKQKKQAKKGLFRSSKGANTALSAANDEPEGLYYER